MKKLKKRKIVWLIEKLHKSGSGTIWLPTIGCALSRADARNELREWKRVYPEGCFRIKAYMRVVDLQLTLKDMRNKNLYE